MTTLAHPVHECAAPGRSSARSSIESTLATSPQALETLRAGWQALTDRLGVVSSQAQPDRLAAVCEHTRSELYVRLFHRRGEPCGLIAGRIVDERPRVRIGYIRVPAPRVRALKVTYRGLLADGPETEAMLIRELNAMLRRCEVDRISVTMLARDSSLFAALRAVKGCVAQRPSVHWKATLVDRASGRPAEVMSGKSRRKVRWRDKHLTGFFNGDVNMWVATQPDDADHFVSYAAPITSASYHAALGVGVTDTPLSRALCNIAAARGHFRSYVLMCGGQPAAYVLGYVHSGTLFHEATAFLPEYRQVSPGSVLLSRIVEDLGAASIHTIDFGFGDAEYKRLYSGSSQQESTLNMYGTRLSARLICALDRSAIVISAASEHLLKRTGWLKKMKQRWRRRLERSPANESKSAA